MLADGAIVPEGEGPLREISFSFLMNATSPESTWTQLVLKASSTSSSSRTYAMWLNQTGYLQLETSDGSFNGFTTLRSADDSIEFGRDYHVAGVIDRNTGEMSIFLNGTRIAKLQDNDVIGDAHAHTSDLVRDPGIADFALFDRVLTAREVSQQWRNEPIIPVTIEIGGQIIAQNVLADGIFSWTVPDTLTADQDYQISVNGVLSQTFTVANNGQHFYVASDGDNANSGKLPSAPMARLRGIFAAYDMAPGDTVHVATGNYHILQNVLIDDAGILLDGPGAVLDRANLNRDSIDVRAPGVSISGLEITGGYDGIDVTADDLSVTGVTIRDHDQHGIYISGADRVSFADSTVTDNGNYGLRVIDSQDLRLSSSTISGSNQYGIFVDQNSHGSQILDSDFDGKSQVQDYGIYVQGNDSLLANNRIFDHSQDGIYITGNTVQIRDSEFFANRDDGAELQGSGGALVYGNSFFGNQDHGIIISAGTGETQVQVFENSVHDNVGTGIYGSNNVLVRDNTVFGHASASGIFIEGDTAIAQGNRSYLNLRGISSGSLSSTTVRNNIVYANSDIGIQVYRESLVDGNQVYSNSIGIQATRHSNFTGRIENNLVYANTNQGIIVQLAAVGARVSNNTIFQAVGDALLIEESSQNLLLRNNIIQVEAGFAINVNPNSQTGLDSDYNLFHIGADPNAHVGFWNNGIADSFADWQAASAQGSSSVEGDPLFVDANGSDNILGYVGLDGGASDNFFLRKGSPAIDIADSWGAPRFDLFGASRTDDPGTVNAGTVDYFATDSGETVFQPSILGVAQGWQADDDTWTLALPFTFTFYGIDYDSVFVSSNGFIDFASNAADSANSDAGLIANIRIAPLCDDFSTVDGDIFVASAADQLTIRWQTDLANFAATLHDDGRIVFDYGSPNAGLSPAAGISAGDGTHTLGAYNGQADLDLANSAEFTVLVNSYVLTNLGAQAFVESGKGINMKADEASQVLALPFDFDYFGVTYDSVNISSNGFLDFTSTASEHNNSSSALGNRVRIAVFWGDLDSRNGDDYVFVDESVSGQVTVRWQTHRFNGPVVDASVTLFDDGSIRMDYADGNDASSATVGLSDGSGSPIVATYSGESLLFSIPTDIIYGETDLGTQPFYDRVGVAQNWRSGDNSWTLNLPFSFPFYDDSYSQVFVSSNGLLQFGTSSNAHDGSPARPSSWIASASPRSGTTCARPA
ncbi:MAG: hypothetical protein ACI8W8_000396 [Rhodothermales bacterium]